MNESLTVILDPTGFPLVRVPKMDFFIAWLPVTKIQFEAFLCDTNLFDAKWYKDMLDTFTPRVSPGVMRLGDYWNIFMTGITPEEAARFANWMGRDYRLPTSQEWKDALGHLAKYPADPGHPEALTTYQDSTTQQRINERAALICRNLERITEQDSHQLSGTEGRRLCDQMMMRLGVVEYVYENSQMNSYAGWGQPNRRFIGGASNPLRDTRPTQLVNRTQGTRMKHFGFRLIRGGS